MDEASAICLYNSDDDCGGTRATHPAPPTMSNTQMPDALDDNRRKRSSLSQLTPSPTTPSEPATPNEQPKPLSLPRPTGALAAYASNPSKRYKGDGATPRLPGLTNQPRLSGLRFVPTVWPHHVVNLRANYNPDAIKSSFVEPSRSCDCLTPCRRNTCRNADFGIFCAPDCCPYGGRCGNGLALSKDILLVKDLATDANALIARKKIPNGVALGEYLGRIALVRPRTERPHNRGYRLMLHEGPRDSGVWRTCIDAEFSGSLLRFANHSSKPSAGLFELANGNARTVVVSTIRQIKAGEEITVNYDDEVWFICRCGSSRCRNRHSLAFP